MEKLKGELFKNHKLGLECGGDPEFIPDLSYLDFKEYYKQYYHPSNSTFSSYGDLDFKDHL